MALSNRMQRSQPRASHAARPTSGTAPLRRTPSAPQRRACAGQPQPQEQAQCGVHRRHVIYSAGLLMSGLNAARAVAAQSSLVTLAASEAEEQLSSQQQPGVAPYPPTYITAPGRVVASEWPGILKTGACHAPSPRC
jgi:hypothetical protein